MTLCNTKINFNYRFLSGIIYIIYEGPVKGLMFTHCTAGGCFEVIIENFLLSATQCRAILNIDYSRCEASHGWHNRNYRGPG